MRLLFLVVALLAATPARAEAPDARASYVERRGVLELDSRCHLFAANIRAALEASAWQARGALLRGGWSIPQVQGLEQTVVAAAQERSCRDPRTVNAAATARTASATWLNANAQTFPGWTRAWYARRSPSPEGWRLSQTITAPLTATFGVRVNNGREQLTLVIATANLAETPNAMLTMRDAARSTAPDIALPQRVAFGLAAGRPAPATATQFIIVSSQTERGADGRTRTAFVFPDTAFRNLLNLDPRESVEVHLGNSTMLLVDVGDVAVARAFLAIR